MSQRVRLSPPAQPTPSARHLAPFVCPGRWPMKASISSAFCSKQAMLHPTRRPFGSTCLLIHQRSRCQASTSLQTQKCSVSPFFHGCPSCTHQATHPETSCGGVLFLFLRTPLLCHTENAASGIARALPHTAEHGLFRLGSFSQDLGQRPS